MRRMSVFFMATLILMAVTGCNSHSAPSEDGAESPVETMQNSTPEQEAESPYESATEVEESKSEDVADMAEEEKEGIYNTYLKPVYMTGLLYEAWTDADEIAVYQLINVYRFNELKDKTVDTEIYAEELEKYIQIHFDVSTEHLRTSEYYQASSNVYKLPAVDGLGGGNVYVERIEKEGNRLLIYYSGEAGIPLQLEVETSTPDFKYISNVVNPA